MTTEPQIADAKALLVMTGRLGRLLNRALSVHLPAELISNTSVMTLFALAEGQSLRPSQIQELTGLSSGGVTKLLDRMQSAGLVAREYGVLPGDRRGSVVTLTEDGRRTTDGVAASILDRMADVRSLIDDMEHLLHH